MWTWEVFQIDNTKATPNFITKLVLSLKCEAWVKQHTLYYPTIKHKWCHGPSNFQNIYIIMFIIFHSFPSKDDTNCLWLTSINIIDKHEVLHICNPCNILVDVNECWSKMFDELQPQSRSKTSWKSIPFKSRLNSYPWLQLFIIIIVEHSGLKSTSSCFWKHEQTLSQGKHN